MKLANAIIVIVLSVITFCGCKKENLTEVDSQFQGIWYSADWDNSKGRKIEIGTKGGFRYDEYENSDGIKTIRGDAVIKQDKITVKKKVGYKNFTVDIFPSYDNEGNFTMKLDGIVYYAAMKPTNLHINNITSTTAFIGWNLSGYWFYSEPGFEYKEVTSSTWISIIPDQAVEATLTNLSPATTYECRVYAKGEFHDSQYTSPIIFTTQ